METRNAVVKTWNSIDAQWGPMTLAKAIAFACDEMVGAHRYVEVKGTIVFDWDEVEASANEALRASDLSLRPRPGETPTDVVARVEAAAKAAT
jgi:hypothetical protein